METLELDSCRIIIYSVVFILLLCFCFRTCYLLVVKNRHSIDSMTNYRWLLFMMILSFLTGFDLLFLSFNDGWWIFTDNTRISRKMDDWGNFASFLTAFFALMSICFAYRALIFQIVSAKKSNKDSMNILDLQIKASRRSSFDATFTQIFAQHKILYDKAMQHKIVDSIAWAIIYGYIDIINNQKGVFALCRERFINFNNKDIKLFWSDFNKAIGQHVSADFKNYFKYIYHEVSLVIQEESINDEMKKRYIGIIQSQMNNDELLCYMINQMDYYLKDKTHEKNNKYIKDLKEYGFFKEICKKNSGYQDYVLKIIGKRAEDIEKDDVFVKKDWLL